MARTLHITVKDKVATYSQRDGFIVCGNSDYVIEFAFDGEWNGHNTKTARFISNGSYEDVVFAGNTVAVPTLMNTTLVSVGVFSGDLKTSTPAVIPCEKSILCEGGIPSNPTDDVYDQIIDLINNTKLQGTDGVSPTISVTKASDGYYLTITDVNGVKTAVLRHGTNGKDGVDGENGKDGVSPTITAVPISNGYRLYITDINGTRSIDVKNGTSGGTVDTSEIENRLDALEKQLYEPIEITSFTTSPAYFEKGSTVTSLTLNWEYNKIPLLQSLQCSLPAMEEELEQDATSYLVSGISATVVSGVSFRLTAYDGEGAQATKSASVTFYNGVYYGSAAVPSSYDSAFILGLTKELRGSKKPSFSVNAGEGQYIYYCLPVSMGACGFTVGGFTGGFSLVDTISFTNASGYTEQYFIYRSDNANLGNTSVTVS